MSVFVLFLRRFNFSVSFSLFPIRFHCPYSLFFFFFFSIFFLSAFFIAFLADFLLYKQPHAPRGLLHLSRCLRLSPSTHFVNHCGAESPFALCFNAVTSLLFLPPPSYYHYLVSPV